MVQVLRDNTTVRCLKWKERSYAKVKLSLLTGCPWTWAVPIFIDRRTTDTSSFSCWGKSSLRISTGCIGPHWAFWRTNGSFYYTPPVHLTIWWQKLKNDLDQPKAGQSWFWWIWSTHGHAQSWVEGGLWVPTPQWSTSHHPQGEIFLQFLLKLLACTDVIDGLQQVLPPHRLRASSARNLKGMKGGPSIGWQTSLLCSLPQWRKMTQTSRCTCPLQPKTS